MDLKNQIQKREIKFRLYSNTLNVMYSPETKIGDLWSIKEAPNGKVKVDDGDILMQFTGLKDKNGKDIYEGDIVQRGVITFSRGKFQGTYYDGSGDLLEDWEDDLYQERNIEVLGNIYENPELLQDDF